MEKTQILNTIKQIREKTPKRKFSQTFDISFQFQNLDLKKQDNKIDLFLELPHSRGKKPKICALVDAELEASAKKLFTTTITKEEFNKYGKDKKLTKKLATSHDLFIAQANIMQLIAKAFGRVFGPKGKMPNPKAGCVVPPTANLEPLAKKLENTIRLVTKGKEAGVKAPAGSESMKDEEIIKNIQTIYDTVIKSLPQGKENIKKVLLKLTMGPSFVIGEKNDKA